MISRGHMGPRGQPATGHAGRSRGHTGRALGRVLTNLSPANLAPSIQVIPSTAAAASTLAGVTFTDWVRCDLASGNLVTDGAVTLSAEGVIRYAKTVPLWNGTDYTSGFRAVEYLGTDTQAFVAAAAATYSLSTSRTLVLCVRMLRPPAVNRGLLGNRAASAAANAGYHATITAPDGAPQLVVCDGSTSATINGPGITDQLDGLGNGALHWIALKIDISTNFATIYAYRTAGTPTAIPAGTKTGAQVFRLGGQNFLYSCETLQVLAFGVVSGADAEGFAIGNLNALDTGCAAPSGLTGHTRAHVTAPIVGSDATGVRVAHYAGSAVTTSKIDFAHAYAAACTAPGNVGAMVERAIAVDHTTLTTFTMRNRLLNTDNLANASWTATNVTATANAGDDPGGFHGAASLTATAGNGTVTQNFTGEADEAFTVSVYAQRNQGSDVAARLSLYNSVGPAELAGVDVTITAARQRFSLTVPAVTVGAVTTLQWRLTITTNGHSIFATYAGANFKWLTSYMPQRAALKSRADVSFWIDNATGQALNIRGGRIEVTCTGFLATVDSTGAYVFSTDGGAGNEDRFFIQRDATLSTYPQDSQHHDVTGATIAQASRPAETNTNEITYAHEWDSRSPLIGEQVRVFDDVGTTRYRCDAASPVPAVAAWTTGSDADRIFPGMRHTSTAHLEGVITAVTVWDLVP